MSICSCAALTALAPIALTFVRESLKTERRRIPHKKTPLGNATSSGNAAEKAKQLFQQNRFTYNKAFPMLHRAQPCD